MNERELRRRFEAEPIPDERDAGERAWPVVKAAFTDRERLADGRRVPVRVLLALALVGAVVAIAVSPAGGWIRDQIGRERVAGVTPARPTLTSLPVPGRLLVASRGGVWVVSASGARRFLGKFEGASWSPRGLFVVAWRRRELVALEPNRTDAPRWALAGGPFSDARWSPSGFRIAYLSGRALRVVVGDGTGDHRVDGDVVPIAPAWRPVQAHILAYVSSDGSVVVESTDARTVLWRSAALSRPRVLDWSPDGSRLLVLLRHEARIFAADGKELPVIVRPSGDATLTAAVFQPRSQRIALAISDPKTGEARVYLTVPGGRGRRLLFAGQGPFTNLVWSPDGRYLAIGWPRANQWLFVPAETGRRIIAIANVAGVFDLRRSLGETIPRIEGWCCAS